ncbi:hypothetical protein PSV08DRAFT_386150 [Bipolaris maydis]|nr:hypothetical protein J3E73DRAFT_396525 [Bipolaris maydis]KAJ6273605.1 hypothetical protein PSV08DRAFT_386150 [Bipolaris maydis]
MYCARFIPSSYSALQMRYTKEERRLSYISTDSNVFRHDRPSVDSRGPLSKPSAITSQRQTPRLIAISPPPLKRKRTACDEPQVRRDFSSLKGLSAPKDRYCASGCCIKARLIRPRNLHGLSVLSTGAQSNHERLSRQSQTLRSLQSPPGYHARRYQNRNVSLMQKAHGPSKAQSKSESSFKPACRVCDKTTAASYNPIIACSGCAGTYHDSCRKPSLTQGLDPQHWRCSTCLSNTEKPAKSLETSKSVLVRYSPVREIFKPRSAQFPAANLSRLPEKTTASEHVDARDFRASSLSARSLESLDRPEEVFEPSSKTEPFGLSDNLKAHMHPLDQLDNLDSSSPRQNVETQVNLVATGSSRQLEIAETPDIAARRSMPPLLDSTESTKFDVSTAGTIRADETKTSFGFYSRRSTLESKIEKINDHAAPYTLSASCNDLDSSNSTEPISASNDAERGTVLQAVTTHGTNTLHNASFQSPRNGQQCENDYAKLPGASETTRMGELPAIVPPVFHMVDEVQAHVSRQSPSTGDAVSHELLSVQLESRDVTLECSLDAISPSMSPQVSLRWDLDDTYSSVCQKRHTNRELARIALACANGASMTASQIVDWLVQKFHYLQKGQSTWEKSLKAVLSRKEFRSDKASGLHGARLMYSFANAAYKARYEEEYRDYIIQCSQEHDQKHAVRPVAVVKSSQGNVSNSAACPQSSAITSTIPDSSFIPSPATNASNGDLPPDLFKLSDSSLVKDIAEYTSEMKRGTSFHHVYPRNTRPSIEMMTTEEKAMKVAEIQARPSRKALFDSGQRLAHVRRYKRLDIHDESDGAWNTQPSEVEGYPAKNEAATRDCDEPRSLCEVFNLPVHAVPMNDGVELAFRDGTLVNGRLPRPRQVYRVGKRLGTGLTVH